MRRSRSRQPRRDNEYRRGTNSRSPAPEAPQDPFFSVIQAEQAELAIRAGVHQEKSLQFYFLDDKHKMVSDEIKHAMIANEIRRIFKENRRQDRNIINMIKYISQEKGVNIETDQRWVKYSVLKMPLVIDANIWTTRDRQNYEDFFKRFPLKDLKMEPNQNLSEIVQQLKLKHHNDLVGVMRDMIKGRVIIHRSTDMQFPDPHPVVIDDEGMTHHVLCEINEVEVVPHKITFVRKEMYNMLGDIYNLTVSQKKEMNVIALSYKEYFRKLDDIEGRLKERQVQQSILIEDDNSEEMWALLQQQADRKKQEELENELLIQRQMNTEAMIKEDTQSQPKVLLQGQRKSNQELETKEIDQQENLNDASIIDGEIDQVCRQYIAAENTSKDEDQMIQALKAIIPGNKRRLSHIQYYLKRGDEYRKTSRTRQGVQIQVKQLCEEIGFKHIKYKTSIGNADITSLFMWKYADRIVDFSYYMMSMQRTNAWWYITDHYAGIWLARSRQSWQDKILTEELQYFVNMDFNQLQRAYDYRIEIQLLNLYNTGANAGKVQIQSQYQWELWVSQIKKEPTEELLIENDAFYEYSNYTIVYVKSKISKARQIKSLAYKIRYTKDQQGKMIVFNVDVHVMIQTLIRYGVLIPGETPLNAYKWGSFNINIFTSSISASMESLLKFNVSAYERRTPMDYINDWNKTFKHLIKEEKKEI